MKNILVLIFFVVLHTGVALAQSVATKANLTEFSLAVANSQGTVSAAYIHDWKFGQKRKINIGVGTRFTSYLGTDQYYVTAPAKLTSGETGPQVLFIENIEANMDSFLIKSAQVNSLNLLIDLNYQVSDKLTIGFNIDAIGFSFGGRVEGSYMNGNQRSVESAKPTLFNILLISDNDRGSLNSELYGRYFLNERWAIKAALQFLFTEYKTKTDIQLLPEPNDRFRKKSLLLSIGVSRNL